MMSNIGSSKSSHDQQQHNTTMNTTMSTTTTSMKERCKRIVLDAIANECTRRRSGHGDEVQGGGAAVATDVHNGGGLNNNNDNEEEDTLAKIAHGLQRGQKLQATILTGGLCNYSYKIEFETNETETATATNTNINTATTETTDGAAVAVFAKLTFGEPLLFPQETMSNTPHCLHARTEYEYQAGHLFGTVSPYPTSVAVPYFCRDVVVHNNTEEEQAAVVATAAAVHDDPNRTPTPAMKLLVTQFAPNGCDEQFAQTFIEGGAILDTKYAVKVANSVVQYHNISPLDPVYDVHFNPDMTPFFVSVTTIIEAIFASFFDPEEEDEAAAGAGNEVETNADGDTGKGKHQELKQDTTTEGEDIKQGTRSREEVQANGSGAATADGVAARVRHYGTQLGKDRLASILTRYRAVLQRKDCYIHGDLHVFNMLVAPAPTMESIIQAFRDDADVVLEKNNPDDDNDATPLAPTTAKKDHEDEDDNDEAGICFIDWEFSHIGPIGKDLGTFYGFPLACVLAHTLNGDYTGAGSSILKFLDIVWNEYTTSILIPPGIESVEDIYYQVLGFTGVMALAYSVIGFHMEYLPLASASAPSQKDDIAKVREGMGVIGLKLMDLSFGGGAGGAASGLTLPELQTKFKEIIQHEIDILTPEATPRPTKKPSRRFSMLRQSGRRVSDAHTWLSMGFAAAASGSGMNSIDTAILDTFSGDGDGSVTTNTSAVAAASRLTAPTGTAAAHSSLSLSTSSIRSKRASILQFEKLLIDIEDGY